MKEDAIVTDPRKLHALPIVGESPRYDQSVLISDDGEVRDAPVLL
jgi:hypothetical protein